MLQFDPNQINANLRGIASAAESACGRSVKAMALNNKDRTLAALAKYVDKPTPFTLRKGAYQASNAKKTGDDLIATMTVADIQSNYLQYVFFGGTRHPGDPGTAPNRILLPGFKMKDRYGGLREGVVAGLQAKADATSRKLKAKTAAQRAKRKGQNTNVQHAWDAAHVAWAKVKGRGAKPAWGFWMFPKRERQVIQQPRYRKDGRPLMRKVNGVLQQAFKKVYRLVDQDPPELLVESRKVTQHKQIIDFKKIETDAQAYGLAQYERYLVEELAKRGLL